MITSKTFELLNQLEAIPDGSGSRTAKLEILKKNKTDLQEYFDIAFNPYRVYKVVQIPELADVVTGFVPGTLSEMVEYLEKQKGGTNESKSMVRNFLNTYCNDISRKWCELAILKNVKMGVDVKTLNKAGYDIPTFELLLASPNKGNDMSGVNFPCYSQEKLNGVRCVYFPKLGEFLGRNGKIVPNINLHEHIKISPVFEEFVIDGELYWPGHDFNEIIGITSSDDKPIPEGFGFHVFNILKKEEWDKQNCETPYIKQVQLAPHLIETSKNIEFVSTKIVNNKEEAMKFFQQIISEPNGEGIMLRGINSLYQWKRVKLNEDTLIKIKQEDEIDGKIIGTYEGENRHENALGGVIVRLDDGIETKVGGGFSDDLRKELWVKRDSLIDQWILIKYTQRTPDNNLLFPIFKGFRDSK